MRASFGYQGQFSLPCLLQGSQTLFLSFVFETCLMPLFCLLQNFIQCISCIGIMLKNVFINYT